MTNQPATSLTADIDTLTSGYLAALKLNSDEIAQLAQTLRAAEKSRAADYREHCEAVRLVMAQRDEARAQIEQITEINLRAYLLVCTARDEARADAERLAILLQDNAERIHQWNYHPSELAECTRAICDDNKVALAAHRAATAPKETRG